MVLLLLLLLVVVVLLLGRQRVCRRRCRRCWRCRQVGGSLQGLHHGAAGGAPTL
jgi:hypothetical protein